MSDDLKLTKEEEEIVIENNKYLNKKFDVSDILALGDMPELDSDADRLICARQVGCFIRKNGLGNHDNFIKFLMTVSIEHATVCLRQLDLDSLTAMMKNEKYKPIVKRMMKVIW
jgi:hypothetical protein